LPREPASAAEGCPALVNGRLEVRSQADLEALRGCTRIEGDLAIYPFGDEDLTPLAALASVGGVLVLGDPFTEPAPLGFSSLAGLESLQTVSALLLRGVRTPSLQSLQALTQLLPSTGYAPSSRYVFIEQAPELADLRGLENLKGLNGFVARSNPKLVSIAGLDVPPALETFEVWDSPVNDIGALGPLLTLTATLWFVNTGLTNVHGLEGIRDVDQLQFSRNAALEVLTGLSALTSVRYVEIRDNPLLSRVDALSGIESAYQIDVIDNPLLGELDLARLSRIEHQLHVTHNSALDSASVPRPTGGSVVVGGNRGEALGVSPCPWSGNGSCEAMDLDDLCAPGSDAVDCGGGSP
jgi:hypothetical protein